MPKCLALLVCCAVLAGPPAAAQLRVGLGVGVLAATTLVRDSIEEPITLRQNVAGVATVSIDGSLDAKTRLGVSFSALRSDVVRRFDTETATLTTLTTWTPGITLSRSLSSSVAVTVMAAVIAYRPETRNGTPFRDDRPMRPAAGLGLRFTRALGSRVGIGVDLNYDIHGFTTQALRGEGIDQRLVHRVSVGATIRRSYGQPRS